MKSKMFWILVVVLATCFLVGTLTYKAGYQAGKNTAEYRMREKELDFKKEKERRRKIDLATLRTDRERQRVKEEREKLRQQEEESFRESQRLSSEHQTRQMARDTELMQTLLALGSSLPPVREPMPPLLRTAPEQVSFLSDSVFSGLNGIVIIADDGTFLGEVSSNPVAPKSISNATGSYGSSIGTESIFNKVGKYGSDISPHSPWNNLTTSPPKVFQFIGYLTTNELKSPRIDPHTLPEYLETQH